ncbi:MAG TPA: ABC transporter ATP-binding protein [Acidimicrobiia bacterium]|jgi:ABC-2 type transport system ATP-binding protein
MMAADMERALTIRGLTKHYPSRQGVVRAVDGLDLDVPAGGVFGFLGANGAGKTTTIRAIVGHLKATSGSIEVLGLDVPRRLGDVIDRVGALVEQPQFFPGFTGRRNLALLAASRGFPKSRVDEVLDIVSLTERADRRYSTYSLGMKQRLGVASVLLKRPDLLILDEPANGLDPAGIIEMRELVRALGAQGNTVFVSSHLLSEIEQTCDRVGIVDRGRIVSVGRVDELLKAGSSRYTVKVPGGVEARDRAMGVLTAHGWTVALDDDGDAVVDVEPERAHEITRWLASEGLYVNELTPVTRTLEEAFLAITGTTPHTGATP